MKPLDKYDRPKEFSHVKKNEKGLYIKEKRLNDIHKDNMKLYGSLNEIKQRRSEFDVDNSPVKGICPGFVHANYILESKETKRLRKNRGI